MQDRDFTLKFGEITEGGVSGVSSVNGMTGDVTLGAGDVGAATPEQVAAAKSEAIASANTYADTKVGQEATAREEAVEALQGNIGTLSTAIEGHDQDIQNLQNDVDGLDEAVQTLEGEVNSIDDKIPDQASDTNQLADKNFVNSSVATNTANYISKTVEGKKVPFDSFEELEAYSGTLTNNDYAFVVGTDSEGNTTYTRYKYNEDEASWGEEYVLNNSSFTAAQWAAINSGITSGKIDEIDEAIAGIPELLGSTGQSTTAGMTQKAITDALASAGGVKVLTTADYNYPVENPDGVALWKLDSGIYKSGYGVRVYVTNSSSNTDGNTIITSLNDDQDTNSYLVIDSMQYSQFVSADSRNGNVRFQGELPIAVVNKLTSSSQNSALSAAQGKALKVLIDSLIVKGAGAPTTSTVGTVGKLYEDITNGDLYQCTAVSGSTYTWEEVGGGGGVNVVQSTGTSTTDIMSQKATTDMIYVDGNNKNQIRMGASANTTGQDSTAIGRNAVAGAYGTAIGRNATSPAWGSVALGPEAHTSTKGEVAIGTSDTDLGYNSTNYRLLTGLHDPVSDHDAATKGYVDSHAGGGDPVYSTKTTSNSANGGAVYIGDKNASQNVLADPTTSDLHYKYFWALPSSATQVPRYNSVNIMGSVDNTDAISILGNAGGYGSVAIGGLSADATFGYSVSIGPGTSASGQYDVSMGYNAKNSSSGSNTDTSTVSIGREAGRTSGDKRKGAINLGAFSKTTSDGEMNIGSTNTAYGYNNTNYRLLTGVHDGQSDHDAMTVGQANALIDAINAALSTNIAHIGASA